MYSYSFDSDRSHRSNDSKGVEDSVAFIMLVTGYECNHFFILFSGKSRGRKHFAFAIIFSLVGAGSHTQKRSMHLVIFS